MKFLLLAAGLCAMVLALARPAAGAKAECDKKTFDRCNEKLFMVGDDTFVMPTSLTEMNKRCKELKPLETCVKGFSSKCLSRDAKQSVSVLSYGVTKTNKGYCSSKARKQIFIRMATCVQKHKLKLDKLMWQMSSDFKAVADLLSDKKIKIPLACCNYYKFKHASVSVINKECPSEDAAEFETLVDGYAQDVLNLFCGEYTEDSDKCSKIMSRTPKWTKKVPSKVFVLPMVDIFDSL